jgi:outer membrane lipoprotein-sorting protein
MKTTRYTISFMLIMAALLATFAAACGGDDDAASSDAPSTTDASSKDKTPATKPAKDGDSSTPAASASSGGNDDAISTLSEAVKDYSKATFKVVYDYTGVSGNGTAFAAKLTTAQKPPKTLLAIDGDMGNGRPGKFSMVYDGKINYMCTTDPDTCLNAGAGPSSDVGIGLSPEDLLDTFSSAAGTDTEVKSTSGQKVAGRDGKCFSVKSKTEGSGTICLDKKTGLLLLLEGVNGPDGSGTINFKATSFDDSPSDDDFKPPYPVSAQ